LQQFENNNITKCISPAALEVIWQMIWHPNIMNKPLQDPPINFTIIIIIHKVEDKHVVNIISNADIK